MSKDAIISFEFLEQTTGDQMKTDLLLSPATLIYQYHLMTSETHFNKNITVYETLTATQDI